MVEKFPGGVNGGHQDERGGELVAHHHRQKALARAQIEQHASPSPDPLAPHPEGSQHPPLQR